jgi:ATP-binding cassette subfamily F protein 3
MITLSKICLQFGSRTIFDELSATLQDDDRIGLVGRNGYGKSTLLKVIAKQQEINSGTISIVSGKRVAYLSQEIVLNSDKPALEHVVDGALQECEHLYSSESAIRAEADKILRGLGLTDAMLVAPVNTLSGGWKMRILLAQLLVLKADFYLFDEPTNHLDIVAKDWFLHFLRRSDAGFLLVCHEKYFLNSLCKKILALDTPQGKFYQGNYDAYCARYEADLLAIEAAYVQQQKMIKQKKETIARFGASASRATQAQSMKKELEKLTLVVPPPKPPTMNIPLPEIKPCGNNVLTVNNLSAGYDDKIIFSGLDFALKRSEKIAIIAPNGVGKTTLLHTLAGSVKKNTGNIEYGSAVSTTLFYQEQALVLNPNLTVWEEVTQNGAESVHFTDGQIRSMLGSFLFSNDDIHKKISFLSGGEKSRVGMIKVLLQRTNLLLLDEPTNHLDIPSKEILLKTLKKYTGTILFVSHDHDFVNELATSVIELTPTSALIYPGNYDSYLQQKEYQNSQSGNGEYRSAKTDSAPEKRVVSFFEQKQIRKLEQAIDRLGKERIKLTAELENLTYGTPDFQTRYNRLQKIDKEEPELVAEWEKYQN